MFYSHRSHIERVEGAVKIVKPGSNPIISASGEMMALQRVGRLAKICMELVKPEVRERIISKTTSSMAEQMGGDKGPSEDQSPA